METLKPPKPMSFEGNIAENWKKWKQLFELYMLATGANTKTSEVQEAILLHVLGEEAVEKFNTFTLTEEQKKEYATVITAWENYCVPRSNKSVERHIFFARNQKEGESFDTFLTDLKKLSASCGFGDLRDSLIKDRIISGINNKCLKDRLLREDTMTLEKCVKLCKTAELANEQLKTLEEDRSIHAISREKKKQQKYKEGATSKKPNWKHQGESRTTRPYGKEARNTTDEQQNSTSRRGNGNPGECQRCGLSHAPRNCPAYFKYCAICKLRGHFAKKCRNNNKVSVLRKNKCRW